MLSTWGTRRTAVRALLVSISVAFAVCSGAEEAKEEAQKPQEPAGEKAEARAAWQPSWYFFWSPSNVHPKLDKSEAQINHQINGIFGSILPGWEKPRTFKDWSGDFELWDLHLGVGRELTPKWSAFIDFGGSAGTAKNDENYWLVVPLKFRVNFGRALWFTVVGADFYPWGKPQLDPSRGRNWFVRAIKSSRPFVELAAGYVHVRETARVKFGLQDSLTFLKMNQINYHDLTYESPRIGIETPLGKNDSISLKAGYLFFNERPDEYDGVSLYIQHSHKF